MFGLSATAIAGIAVGAAGVGSAAINYMGAQDQKEAAMQGASEQERMQMRAIDEQTKRLDDFRALMNPFMRQGQQAGVSRDALIGLGGQSAQRYAIRGIAQGQEYGQLLNAANNNILQNASATGGLRGGNTQAALATISPQILSQLIDKQYGRLDSIYGVGANAASSIGNQTIATGNNISQGYSNIGDVRATALLGGAAADAKGMAAIGQGIGSIGGALGGYYMNNTQLGQR